MKNGEEKAAFKTAMYADLATRPEAEQKAFYEAQSRLNEAMMNHMKNMEKRLKKTMKRNKETHQSND